jgi:hypothetical protein
MARVRIPLVVLGPDGRPLAGATAAVRRRSDGAAVNVYAAETGGTTLTAAQIVTDAGGRMAGWTDRGALEATITGPAGAGLAPYVVAWEALPAGDAAGEAAWLPDNVIATRMVAASSVSYAALAADAIAAMIPVGACIPFIFPALPAGGRFDWADGGLIDRATQGGAGLYAGAGHAYNGGVDPGGNMVRKPDKRGRGSIGADNFGTAQGAAGRLSAGHNARGQGTGAESRVLVGQDLPLRSYTIDNTTTVVSAPADNNDGPANAFSGRSTPRWAAQPVSLLQPSEVDLWIVRLY